VDSRAGGGDDDMELAAGEIKISGDMCLAMKLGTLMGG
jgi:hypothetical protein